MAFKKRMNKDFDIIVGSDSQIKGDVISEGSVRIDGKVSGSVISKGDVIIGDHAIVTANIEAAYCEISGQVEGSVHTEQQLKIFKSGNLNGDITVSSFTIEEGGIFRGNCDINPDKKDRKSKKGSDHAPKESNKKNDVKNTQNKNEKK